MNLHEFFALSRDDRSDRIAAAEDNGTCSVCEKPILSGQPRNGLYHSHYDCTYVEPISPGRLEEISDRADRALKALEALGRRK